MKRETQYPLAKNALSLIKEAVNHSVKDIKTIYRNLDAEQLDACPRFHGDRHAGMTSIELFRAVVRADGYDEKHKFNV